MNVQERDALIAVLKRLGMGHAAKDAAMIVDCYAADATIYSLAPPLGSRGMDQDEVRAWLATWEGPIDIDSAESELVVGADLAWVTGFNRMRGTKTDGDSVDIWFRTTLCLRKQEGRWRIVHDHSSTPFYMDGSGRAAVDLTPDGQARWNDPAP